MTQEPGTAFELAAVGEKLLPVLEVSRVHLEESRSAGIAGLQHLCRSLTRERERGGGRRERPP